MRIINECWALLISCAVHVAAAANHLDEPLCAERGTATSDNNPQTVMSRAEPCSIIGDTNGIGATNGNILADVEIFREIRNELAMGVGTSDVGRLCTIQSQLEAATDRESELDEMTLSSAAALFVSLGDNWEAGKNYPLARASYLRSYQLSRRANAEPQLRTLTALQRLTQWESDHGAQSCASDLAAAQERLARRLYNEAAQPIMLVAQAMELTSEVLRKQGDLAGAAKVAKQAERLKEQEKCRGVCRQRSR